MFGLCGEYRLEKHARRKLHNKMCHNRKVLPGANEDLHTKNCLFRVIHQTCYTESDRYAYIEAENLALESIKVVNDLQLTAQPDS